MATVPLSSKWLKSALQWLHASSLTDVHICLPHLFPHLPPPLPPSCLLLCRHAKAADLAPWWRSMNPLHAAAFLNWRAPCLASIAHIATTSADTAGTSVCLLQSTRDKAFIEPDTLCHFMINCTKRLLFVVILVCSSLSLSQHRQHAAQTRPRRLFRTAHRRGQCMDFRSSHQQHPRKGSEAVWLLLRLFRGQYGRGSFRDSPVVSRLMQSGTLRMKLSGFWSRQASSTQRRRRAALGAGLGSVHVAT